MLKEEKNQKFIEIAERRVNNILHDIEILKTMTHSQNYDYTENEINAMFSVIEEEIADTKNKFLEKLEKAKKTPNKTFSFGNTENKNTDVFAEILEESEDI